MAKTSWSAANFLSVGNAVCGTLGIFQILSQNFRLAAILLVLAVGFDFLDGKVARFLKQDTLFGKGLDCLSDMISFGVAPAAFGYPMVHRVWAGAAVILSLFVVAGAWRLAYFFQWGKAHRPPGMPITLNGLIFPFLFFAHASDPLFLVGYAVATGLMVVPIFLKQQPIT